MAKRRELVSREDVDKLIDGIAGITLTALSSLPAHRVVILRSGAASSASYSRCAPRSPRSAKRWLRRTASLRWTSRSDRANN